MKKYYKTLSALRRYRYLAYEVGYSGWQEAAQANEAWEDFSGAPLWARLAARTRLGFWKD